MMTTRSGFVAPSIIKLASVAAVLLLAVPLVVEAQQAQVPRIGVLLTVDLERTRTRVREELRGLGYVEGRNVLLEFRLVPAGQADRLPDLAAELVRLKVDIIVAQFTPAALAAKAATTAIPIVMAPAGNPIETRLVASLARPGGNVTGVAGVASELGGKKRPAYPRDDAVGTPCGRLAQPTIRSLSPSLSRSSLRRELSPWTSNL
jgi:putative ABC transport system substrate-binding protein